MVLTQRRIGLVGCVKDKTAVPQAAKDLYVSALFAGRRSYVERSSDSWWILSAEHGLVHPDEVLAPYNVTLKDAGRLARRSWSNQLLLEIDDSSTGWLGRQADRNLIRESGLWNVNHVQGEPDVRFLDVFERHLVE